MSESNAPGEGHDTGLSVVGGGYTIVCAVIAISLHILWDVPWIIAALIGAAWMIVIPIALVILVGVLIYTHIAWVAAIIGGIVFISILIGILAELWKTLQAKRFTSGRSMPYFVSRKLNNCVEADSQIFGSQSLDALTTDVDSIEDPVEACRSISNNGSKVLRQDREPWKEFSVNLSRLCSEHRRDILPMVEKVAEARDSLFALSSAPRWRNIPDAGKGDEESDEKLHEEARQFLRAAVKQWKKYVDSWDALLVAYKNPEAPRSAKEPVAPSKDDALECPSCGISIPIDNIKDGMNQCTSCLGVFKVKFE